MRGPTLILIGCVLLAAPTRAATEEDKPQAPKVKQQPGPPGPPPPGGLNKPTPLPALPFNPYAGDQQLGFYPGLQPHAGGYPGGYPIQPQILYYSGTGQPFLVNPPNAPPGNFLMPHHPHQPPTLDPSFFGGHPGFPSAFPQFPGGAAGGAPPRQQPHLPPIDKDAEEIPMNTKPTPQQDEGAANKHNNKDKPQKIELDGNDEEEQDGGAQPLRPTRPGFFDVPQQQPQPQPGRYFILNGQPLYRQFPGRYQSPPQAFYGPGVGFGQPLQQQQHQPFPAFPERFLQSYPHPGLIRPTTPSHGFYQQPQQQPPASPDQQFKQFGPVSSVILQNQPQLVQQHIVPPHLKNYNFPQQSDGLPITLHNQVLGKDLQTVVLTAASPSAKDALQSRYYEKTIPFDREQSAPVFDDYYKYTDGGGGADDAAIIIDAKYQETQDDNDTEGITERPAESSVAEAQPGAVALAGVGGVAAAGPRGTALAGEGGLAVSSPHATAVAGPAKDDERPAASDKKAKKAKSH